MDFITALGIIGISIKDIIGYIRKKCKSEKVDYNNFKKQLEKHVIAACNKFREFISQAPDYKNVEFLEDYDSEIYIIVLKALEKNKPLKKEDCTNSNYRRDAWR